MKYTFSYSSSVGDETEYVCDAKSLDDAISQFAISVYVNGSSPSSFSYYYYVKGKSRISQRVFNFDLQRKFWTFYKMASIMDERYGIDKKEIL